jgi:putative DNA primase/helicase
MSTIRRPDSFPKTSLRERTRGRWFGILTTLGIDAGYLRNKHGPCPVCGGKDRFRWDNKNDDGTFYCNQCGAGSGVDLVMQVRGLSFREAAPLIEEAIGEARPQHPRPPERSEADKRAALRALWQDSSPIRRDDPVDRWFRGRSIKVELYPAVLRFAPRARYAIPVSYHPAMLALLSGPDGKPATIHKTYLTSDGNKAPVEEPRRFAPAKIPDGAAVRLAPYRGTLGIAEGIETAFAAMALFGIPCWAALNAGLLEKFQPPAGVNHLVIYGDNDAHQRGQRAAWALAARLKIKTDIYIPDQVDTDWNDVLMNRGAR